MSSIVAVGSMAFDSIETPNGKVDKVLGGSVNHFSISASFFSKVLCVAVVGDDFPDEHLGLLKDRGIDIDGIKVTKGKTFHWSGRYESNLNEAQTLDTQLNVFEKFEPNLPAKYRDAEFVFLGNIAPGLQIKVLEQVRRPKFVALDTMNYWIDSQKDTLKEAISRCHCLVINEAEIKSLTQHQNVLKAAETVSAWGPASIVIKRGEYGAMLLHRGRPFCLPALPIATVKDPTGAGDSFAGGFMGYLAARAESGLSDSDFRTAIVCGSIMASFIIQDFGFNHLLKIRSGDIAARYKEFAQLTAFDSAILPISI